MFDILGADGEVRNLGIKGGSVKTIGPNSYVGGLVGQNNGTIRACYMTGNVRAEIIPGAGRGSAGDLVGHNRGVR